MIMFPGYLTGVTHLSLHAFNSNRAFVSEYKSVFFKPTFVVFSTDPVYFLCTVYSKSEMCLEGP